MGEGGRNGQQHISWVLGEAWFLPSSKCSFDLVRGMKGKRPPTLCSSTLHLGCGEMKPRSGFCLLLSVSAYDRPCRRTQVTVYVQGGAHSLTWCNGGDFHTIIFKNTLRGYRHPSSMVLSEIDAKTNRTEEQLQKQIHTFTANRGARNIGWRKGIFYTWFSL